MRPGPNKRSRGRGNGGNPHHNRPRMPHRIQVFERYVALAREAASSGDRIAAENLYQHAEHYFRVMNANGEGNPHGASRPMTPADVETGGPEPEGRERSETFVQPPAPATDEQSLGTEPPYSSDTPPFG